MPATAPSTAGTPRSSTTSRSPAPAPRLSRCTPADQLSRPETVPPQQKETAMRGTVIHGTRDVRLEERPDPTILEPTDAVVRTVAACVCGSDLWRYRGIQQVTTPTPIGHE